MAGTEWLRSLIKHKPKRVSGQNEQRCAAGPDTKASARIELPEPTEEEIGALTERLGAVLAQPLGPASREQTQRLVDEQAAETRAEKARLCCPCLAIYSACRCTPARW
jgi:hypothetical protein